MDPRVDDFIEIQRETQKELFTEIRQILLSFEPLLEETIKWKTPFYTHNGKSVCYMSTKSGKDFVQVAFIRGFELENVRLVADGRTVIRALEFYQFGVEEDALLQELLRDAITLES